MAERRTLADALAHDDQKVAFIDSGPPRRPNHAATQGVAETPASNERAARALSKRLRSTEAPRRPPEEHTPSTRAPNQLTTPVVSITTRYRQQTAEALRRASLERKLSGEHPNTQQEMVELAVSTWLEENGYLAGRWTG